MDYGWLVDVLLTALGGLLMFELREHKKDDSDAHVRIRTELKAHSDVMDSVLEKRIERIEKYLDDKLKNS